MKQSEIPDHVSDIPAYNEGRKARQDEKPRLNPYHYLDGLRVAAWFDGWDDADAELAKF